MSLFEYLDNLDVDDDEIVDAIVDDFAPIIDCDDESEALIAYGF